MYILILENVPALILFKIIIGNRLTRLGDVNYYKYYTYIRRCVLGSNCAGGPHYDRILTKRTIYVHPSTCVNYWKIREKHIVSNNNITDIYISTR